MSRPLYEPTTTRDAARGNAGVDDLRRRPLADRWLEPDSAEPDQADTPPLENNWAQPSPPLEKFAFRLHMDGSLEFKGHLDASGGAVSGTVAVTLPGPDPTSVNPSYWLPNDQYWHTTITEDDGVTFSLALVFMDSTNGEVTITWPAT